MRTGALSVLMAIALTMPSYAQRGCSDEDGKAFLRHVKQSATALTDMARDPELDDLCKRSLLGRVTDELDFQKNNGVCIGGRCEGFEEVVSELNNLVLNSKDSFCSDTCDGQESQCGACSLDEVYAGALSGVDASLNGIIDADIDAGAATNVTLSNASGSTVNIKGLAGGT